LKRVRWRAVIDRTATARIQRLIRWLEPFQRRFGHRAQRLALRTYVHGLFSDSDRKSMQAMLDRVTQPITYHAFQHFVTHATWDPDRIWRRLLEVLPERDGVLIIDGTIGAEPAVEHRRQGVSGSGASAITPVGDISGLRDV
jgi:SRSO17 transposase